MPSNDLERVKEDRDFLIKQSEMLQSIIKRMADNSLEAKKFGLTVWAAIVGFGFQNRNPILFILAFISFTLFGLLDIYYLYMEREFRKNFNRLVRIIGGYASNEDYQWVEQMKIKQRNFFIPDSSPDFFRQIFSKDSVLKSWANLPYLITFLITMVLMYVPLPSK
ncbi:MAG: hypothetical protein RMZ43_026110 [Nostoc sp. CmiVER01]|uniref:hypothetical protein n=1 Tax=Nostoc sp. CmiVER01 TaxID=3075384 RepID=UPI002AD46683|nr:hypothetical protein [Nostoc sp. CmiVER01]MDZ8121318.1 hypothetical protein [Nostoc sp. CmiVER01]